jgi:hypothetical protein
LSVLGIATSRAGKVNCAAAHPSGGRSRQELTLYAKCCTVAAGLADRTNPETDVTAADFAGYACGCDRNLGSEPEHRHYRATSR